ncbi:unnamed protein product [marine sediment metagenome]|uniref:N-acetyltransferase domain-containing protein n=1 Tax=marine sediment metagenome TaxID=412755 RepID=X0U9X7_9ZZZZ
MSKRQSQGYQKKLKWLKARFAEGMKIKMLKLPERGFIEYLPGEYAWRAVKANGYMFIHCLWVVGKSKGKGYAALLLNECIKEAEKSGMQGVAVITSEGNWLAGKKCFLKQGFESVEQAPPSFELMVKKFSDAPSPCFTNGWDKKLSQFGGGLTIIRSDQCPYIEDAAKILLETAAELGIKSQVVELHNCQEAQNLVPSAFGVFSVIYAGNLISYHYLTKNEFLKRLDKLRKQ